jgi:hypothetical protein
MNALPRPPRRFLRALGWTALLGLSVGLFFAYRWAGSVTLPVAPSLESGGPQVMMRLEGAPFTSYVNGRKTWSLWAGRIDLERLPGSALANLQRATLTDIRNGKLYAAPPNGAAIPPVTPASATEFPALRLSTGSPNLAPTATPDSPDDLPAATFRANSGLYALGTLEPPPAEIAPLYDVQWQFKLKGGVEFKTQAGDRLRSDSLILLEMISRRTHRTERRILCDQGAKVDLKDVQVQANRVRYDPAERTVECLGGVRGTFKGGVMQAERLFWSLKDQVLRCPETATGTYHGMPFTWEGLTVDLKRRVLTANRVHGQIRIEEEDVPSLR